MHDLTDLVDVQLLECMTHHMHSNNTTAAMDTVALMYVLLFIGFILQLLVNDRERGGGAEAGTGTGEEEEQRSERRMQGRERWREGREGR